MQRRRERAANEPPNAYLTRLGLLPQKAQLVGREADREKRRARRGILEHAHTLKCTYASHTYATLLGVAHQKAQAVLRTWQARDPDNPAGSVSWVEYELEEPWTVALGFQEREGELVLAALSVFPTRNDEADRSLNPRVRERELGQWRPDAERVPRGGLSIRRVLRSVTVSAAAREALRQSPSADDYLAAAGFVAADRLPATPSRGKRRDPVLLAQIAVMYEEALRNGDHPTVVIAAQIDYSLRSVPGLVRAARDAGYLTPANRGRPSGTATEKARRLLAEAGPA